MWNLILYIITLQYVMGFFFQTRILININDPEVRMNYGRYLQMIRVMTVPIIGWWPFLVLAYYHLMQKFK